MAAAALDDDFSDLEASDFEDEAVSCSAATRRQAGNTLAAELRVNPHFADAGQVLVPWLNMAFKGAARSATNLRSNARGCMLDSRARGQALWHAVTACKAIDENLRRMILET